MGAWEGIQSRIHTWKTCQKLKFAVSIFSDSGIHRRDLEISTWPIHTPTRVSYLRYACVPEYFVNGPDMPNIFWQGTTTSGKYWRLFLSEQKPRILIRLCQVGLSCLQTIFRGLHEETRKDPPLWQIRWLWYKMCSCFSSQRQWMHSILVVSVYSITRNAGRNQPCSNETSWRLRYLLARMVASIWYPPSCSEDWYSTDKIITV